MAVTNSYMLPHGTRCSESPRVRIPRMWVTSPSTVRASAARIHGPAGAPPARQRLAATVPTAPVPAPPPRGEAGGPAGGPEAACAAAGDADGAPPAAAVTPAGTATRAGSVAPSATAPASAVLPCVAGR